MKISSKAISMLGVFLLVACGSTSSNNGAYRPAILENAVDMNKYEQDRSDCERSVKNAPSNMESTNSIRFRECVTKKGYKLLS